MIESIGWIIVCIIIFWSPIYLATKGYSDLWYIYFVLGIFLSTLSYAEGWVSWERILLVNLCSLVLSFFVIQICCPNYSFNKSRKRKLYLGRIKNNDDFIPLGEITYDEFRTMLIECESLKLKVKLPKEIIDVETALQVPVHFQGLEKGSQEMKLIKELLRNSDDMPNRKFSLKSNEEPYLLIRITGLCQYQYEWYFAIGGASHGV